MRDKKLGKKLMIKLIIIATGALMIIGALIPIGFFAFAGMEEGLSATGNGRSDISFAVHYIENEMFPENPVPSNLHFLRLFTDFIEIESGFSASFSDEFELVYTYTSRTRFEITHATVGGGNPVIFQETNELNRISGRTFGNSVNFRGAKEDQPGGTYIINLHDHLAAFNEFLEYHEQQMEAAGATGGRNFSAELFIEFTYTILAQPVGIHETLTRGYRIPISSEVFTLEPTGASGGFTAEVALGNNAQGIEAGVIIGLAAVAAAGALLIFYGLVKLGAEKSSSQHAMTHGILKKYSGEIIVALAPLDLTDHKIVRVGEFEEVLKLSINLNKHITCHKSSQKAEFCVIVDDYAYSYQIDYISPDFAPINDYVHFFQSLG